MSKYNGTINRQVDPQSYISDTLNTNKETLTPETSMQNHSTFNIHTMTDNKRSFIDKTQEMNGMGKKKRRTNKKKRRTNKKKRRTKTKTKTKTKKRKTKRRKTINRKQKGGKGIKLEVAEIESAPTIRGPINELTKHMVKLNAIQIQNANASTITEPTNSVISRFTGGSYKKLRKSKKK